MGTSPRNPPTPDFLNDLRIRQGKDCVAPPVRAQARTAPYDGLERPVNIQAVAAPGVNEDNFFARFISAALIWQQGLTKSCRDFETYAVTTGSHVIRRSAKVGVHAAEGLDNGLESQQKNFESATENMCRILEVDPKYPLAIWSPSRKDQLIADKFAGPGRRVARCDTASECCSNWAGRCNSTAYTALGESDERPRRSRWNPVGAGFADHLPVQLDQLLRIHTQIGQ